MRSRLWPLGVVAALILLIGFLFFDLAHRVAEHETQHFDQALLSWVAQHRSPRLTTLFLAITALGAWPVLALFSVGICVGAWLSGQGRMAITLALAMAGVPPLSSALKGLYSRARPSVVAHLEAVTSSSFPSGHSISSMVFFVTVALLVHEHARRRSLRLFLLAYSLLLASLVAVSRVYLGVHYPSDVVGGALVGVAWSLLALALDRLLLRSRLLRRGEYETV